MSPSLLEKVSYVGTLLKSFPQASQAVQKLLEMALGRKRIERITERVGAERLEHADEEVARFEALTLMAKVKGPQGVTAPTSCAVMVDGGRYQKTEQNPDATSEKSTHWFEYKAGLCLNLQGRRDGLPAGPEASDPHPDVPEMLLNLDYVDELTREIGQKAAAVTEAEESEGAIDCGPLPTTCPAPKADDPEADAIDLEGVRSIADVEARVEAALGTAAPSVDLKKKRPLSPKVASREVVATLEKGHRIGLMLAARAWARGMFQSTFQAFVGDGSAWIWTIFTKFFQPFGFIPILDIIHAVTYVYAAATAGRTRAEGAAAYHEWVGLMWNGRTTELIAAVAARLAELGPPEPDESATSPRSIVSAALTYLRNQQSRMDYPRYRKLGLPITSSHMESAVKELNYRLKGSEKFWSADGGASVLQMKSDTLSDSDPLARFWSRRAETRTGLHANVGRRKPTQSTQPTAAA